MKKLRKNIKNTYKRELTNVVKYKHWGNLGKKFLEIILFL